MKRILTAWRLLVFVTRNRRVLREMLEESKDVIEKIKLVYQTMVIVGKDKKITKDELAKMGGVLQSVLPEIGDVIELLSKFRF